MDFADLPIQQSSSTPHSAYIRRVRYNKSDVNRLGKLMSISLDEFPLDSNLEGSDLHKVIQDTVEALKKEGKLPETAGVDAGNSHIVVFESDYTADDIFAIEDLPT